MNTCKVIHHWTHQLWLLCLVLLTEVKKEDASLLRKLLHSKLINSKKDIEVLRKDPNSPLHSVKSFEALNL